jgi:hypothetical protein
MSISFLINRIATYSITPERNINTSLKEPYIYNKSDHMDISGKAIRLFASFIGMLFITGLAYKNGNIFVSTGAAILLGITINEIASKYGQLRKRYKH